MPSQSTLSTQSSRYLTTKPTAIARGPVHIESPPLRDVIACPNAQGVLIYPGSSSGDVVEQNLNLPNAPIRKLLELPFTPSCHDAIGVGCHHEDTVIAAAGSDWADLHLSYHVPGGDKPIWEYKTEISQSSNTSVFLTKGSSSNGREPRVGVTSTDQTFRLYEIATRPPTGVAELDADLGGPRDLTTGSGGRLSFVGSLRLDTHANYAAMSPSGRTLLTVGDSQNVYLHHITGSSRATFHPMAAFRFPKPKNTPLSFPTEWPSLFTAAYALDWSRDGSKYAVGTQEGVVAVYDIRSTKPLKVFQTDKMRGMTTISGAASSEIWDPVNWGVGQSAPPWSIRSVKFGGDENGVNETLVFSEHTSLVHVVDAKTLEGEEIILIPSSIASPSPPSPLSEAPLDQTDSLLPSIQLQLPTAVTTPFTDPYRSPLTTTSLPNLWQNPNCRSPRHGAPPNRVNINLLQERQNSTPPSNNGQSSATRLVPTQNRRFHSPRNPRFSKDRNRPGPGPKRHRETVLSNGYVLERADFVYRDELDIAGVCFDPSGEWLYVGTDSGVVEWGVED